MASAEGCAAALLCARDLSRPGLEPTSLSLATGEAVALTGPSGAGKSLLLRALAELDPCEGEVSLEGRGRQSMPATEWRRAVTYVAATPGWWAATVGQHFRPEDLQGAVALLERLGLPADVLDWEVGRLSTGEAQRIALIRALVQRPRVLLLDEPTAGLDGEATEQVEAVLAERLAEGAAILFVSHDPLQAERLGRRRLAMRPGGHLERA